jgi:hypothetical protein
MRLLTLGLLVALVATAADKKPKPSAHYRSDEFEIAATLHNGKDAVRELVGSDLQGAIAVVDIQIQTKTEKPLKVLRDDFTLRSDKDGQRAQPYAPSQIAGRTVMVVSSTGGGRGIMSQESGPIWGGIGGPPRRAGGDGGTIGNTSESSAQTTVVAGSRGEKENPLLSLLEQKILPEKETSEPLRGLLYFPLDGKHKDKDLELQYKGPAGRATLRFRQDSR